RWPARQGRLHRRMWALGARMRPQRRSTRWRSCSPTSASPATSSAARADRSDRRSTGSAPGSMRTTSAARSWSRTRRWPQATRPSPERCRGRTDSSSPPRSSRRSSDSCRISDEEAVVKTILRQPFGQALLILAVAYVVFEFGIAYLPPHLGIRSAPVPDSALRQSRAIVFVGVLIYVSDNEERWKAFKRPIHAALVDADKRWVRTLFLTLLPVLVGFMTFDSVRPKVSAPPTLRSIHPAPPTQITFRGKTINL